MILIVEKLATDERFRGPPGDKGATGDKGEQGADGTSPTLDMDKLVAAIIAKLPTVQVHYLDKSGGVVHEDTFAVGEPIRVPPLLVRTLDQKGAEVDRDAYPYPWGVQIKPLVVRIPVESK